MDRKFSEVFGELGLRKDIAEFFSDVTVSKVSKVTARRLLRVYITYDRMIMKDRIIALEAELARVLCGDSNWQVQVCEDYHLSSQYSTQYVVDNYYPSVLMEIDRHDKTDDRERRDGRQGRSREGDGHSRRAEKGRHRKK